MQPSLKVISHADSLHKLLSSDPQIPFDVIDDGCHERTEAGFALAVQNGFAPSRLGRVFLINLDAGNYLKMPKPLAKDGQLEEWFMIQRHQNRLIPESHFVIDDHKFKVDQYGALRSTRYPDIYLDDSRNAFWGVSHISLMLDDQVVDPSFKSGVLSLHDWKQNLGEGRFLPLVSHGQHLPELAVKYLTPELTSHLYSILCEVFPESYQVADDLDKCHVALLEIQKFNFRDKNLFYDHLFASQIASHGILPREYWNEISPSILTTRGEDYRDFSFEQREQIDLDLKLLSWENRYNIAIEVLAPFRAFQKLIQGGDFEWHPK